MVATPLGQTLGMVSFLALLITALMPTHTCSANTDEQKAAVGKLLFFDTTLSTPAGRSCASCHDPNAGYADPNRIFPVTQGAVAGRFAPRNAPTVRYAAFTPARHFDQKEQHFVGGLFLDGRADTLEAQAAGPLLSPLEMNNRSEADVVAKVQNGRYAALLRKVYGNSIFDNSKRAFAAILDALASYERSDEVNPFSSKYDLYLQGKAALSATEQRGLKIFEREDKGNCAACHPNKPGDKGEPPLFTDFTYDNLGVPANPNNPYLKMPHRFNTEGNRFIDYGLGKSVNKKNENGKFRVPTLRNISLTAPYMHNGVIATLKEAVEFYNQRDKSDRWNIPEVAENVNKEELGDLNLSEQEIDDLVAFLETLTDGYNASVNTSRVAP